MNPYLNFALILAASGLGAYLASYLKQKGKNLATKEDVDALTRAVEDAKQDYREQMERLKSDLQRILIVSKIQIEREVSFLPRTLQSLGRLAKQVLPNITLSGAETGKRGRTSGQLGGV